MGEEKNKQELAITVSKEKSAAEWYTQVLQKADLIEYTEVSGCIIFKPNIFQIWEKVQSSFDQKIKKLGVRNAYFPLFIPEKFFVKEGEHVEDFAPEVAWVTHGGGSELNEKLAIRPTSETIINDAYAKWIQSYRDLPLKMNQWCNVVRWEFKHPTPLLRNREFLWQEGHTAFETQEEAHKEVLEILEKYREVAEEVLAVPVDLGMKTEKEKFAGAEYTTTMESFLPDGKALQSATSHHLGQKFAKAFDIEYIGRDQKKHKPYQNSWGISTRMLGAFVMIHGDDKGLIVPPRAAENQIVIVPLLFKGKEKAVEEEAFAIKEKLSEYGAFVDDRKEYSPGFKYNEWELKGIPLRIEIGPKDLENNRVMVVRRDTLEKEEVAADDKFEENIEEMLENIQNNLYERAREKIDNDTYEVYDYQEFKKLIDEGKRCLVPWKEDKETEEKIKEETGAKTSCKPFKENREKSLEGVKCFFTGEEADTWVYFAKSH